MHRSSGSGKTFLKAILDRLEAVVPVRLRESVRGPYLEHFYFRLYPELRPRPVSEPEPGSETGELTPPSPVFRGGSNGEDPIAFSRYEPFLDFKRQICGSLPLACEGLCSHLFPGRVSIVLPVYNGALYLREAMESVLGQTDRNLELIVVDDGSTDATPKILAGYTNDPRVTVIRQPNQKLPSALNSGFARAGGEFLTWTSADNIMAPGHIQSLRTFLQEQPCVEMAYCDLDLIDESGSPLAATGFHRRFCNPARPSVVRWPRDPGPLNFTNCNSIGAAFLYRSWAARIAGDYMPSAFGFEDYEYFMRMNALFRIAHTGAERATYQYRIHSDSLTARAMGLSIPQRVYGFQVTEVARQRHYTASRKIEVIGDHPWFQQLPQTYLRAGHDSRRVGGLTKDLSGNHEPASLLFVDAAAARRLFTGWPEGLPGNPVTILFLDEAGAEIERETLRRCDWIVASDKRCWQAITESGFSNAIFAEHPDEIAYPLIALAGRLTFERMELAKEPGVIEGQNEHR